MMYALKILAITHAGMVATIIVGILGLLFIAVGWILALGDVPPLRLTIPYLVGSALLTHTQP